MVHVGLDELQGFILDHSSRVGVKILLEIIHLLSGDTFTVFGSLEGFLQNALDVLHRLNTLSHAEAEVSEPLVVHSDCPVLTKEFGDVWNDSLVISCGQVVEIVLVETNESPKTLKNDFFAAHISDGVDDTDAVKGELNEVALCGFDIKVVTS